MAQSSDLVIENLQGGQNDTDPPNSLPMDQVVLAENIEFFGATMGERRGGCKALDLGTSGLDDEAIMVHLSQWYFDNDVLAPQIFAVSATPNSSVTVATRTGTIWTNPTIVDAIDTAPPDVYHIKTQSLNGKLFVSYHAQGDVDRMHVWDGTSIRPTGLTEPAAPVVNDGAPAGSFAGVRYYRVRYTTKDGAVILTRSEPSEATTFTPLGTRDSAVISKPASINEGETDWEIEASLDDSLFYVIGSTDVGTTTFTDSDATGLGYAGFPLSDAIGAYLLQPAARYLAVDGDRLIGAGHWFDATKQSQVWWTPVSNDPGVGSDERLPIVTTGGASLDNTLNLDNYDGGPITGIASGNYGTWYVFKWDHIYKMVRTNDPIRAYDSLTISNTRGAIEGSVVPGVDETGASCIYFLDPLMGPSRLGPQGLQRIDGLRGTWGRVNLQAGAVVACGVYYPYKQQLHWWVAVDGSDRPNYKLVLQVSELQRVSSDAVGRGWSVATGRITEATCACIITEVVDVDGVFSLSERPFIGLSAPDFICRCDCEGDDNGTVYYATLRTRPYLVTGLLNKWGALTCALLADANDTQTLTVKFIRDFGVETTFKTTDLLPVATEDLVIKKFDSLAMMAATTIQVEITDAP